MLSVKAERVLQEAEEFIIKESSAYMEQVGIKTTLGRIFGLLIAQSRPLSLREISERLKLSKPAVSTTIKSGLYIHLFRKVHQPDSPREDFYVIGVDFMEIMIDPGMAKFTFFINNFTRAREIIISSGVDINENEDLKILYERVNYLAQAFEMILEEYKIFADSIRERLKELKNNVKA